MLHVCTYYKYAVCPERLGLGSFEPRKPLLENLSKYEGEGVQYSINEPNLFFKKKVFISGGGDSALDWAIYLAENSSQKICLPVAKTKTG